MPTPVVVREIAVLLLVVLVGFLVRRIGLLDEPAVRRGSRLVVDVTMPALVFTQLLQTTSADALRAQWYAPVVGAGLLVVAWAVARLASPLGAGDRATFTFVAGLPNWIYLPLPIAAAVHGDAGVRAVLLVNVGAMLLLWTLGVRILSGRTAWRDLLANPGLIATVAAIGGVLFGARLPEVPGGAVIFDALDAVGSLTVPLALLLTGAQIGGVRLTLPSRTLVVATLVRLLVAPLVTLALLAGLAAVGWRMPGALEAVVVLVAAMPVAISGSMFAERFGGDVGLASQAILWTTPLSLATVPVVIEAGRLVGL